LDDKAKILRMKSGIYSKVIQTYMDGGAEQVLKKSLQKIRYLIYHTNNAHWYRLDLRNVTIENNMQYNDITVDLDNKYETISYIKEYGYYYPMEINIGLVANHLYSSLKYNGKIIGYNKTGYSKVYIEDFKKVYTFPDKVAFTYDTFIDPKYRNRKLGTYLLGEVCKKLKEQGFKSIWAHISPWNIASITMHQRLGFKKYSLIIYYYVLGISWTTYNPVRLIQHFEKISNGG